MSAMMPAGLGTRDSGLGRANGMFCSVIPSVARDPFFVSQGNSRSLAALGMTVSRVRSPESRVPESAA